MRGVSALPTSENQVRLIVAPTAGQPGRFDALADGELIISSSKTPLLDAARALIAAGADPTAMVIMLHAGSDTIALTATIMVAAGLVVEESGHGPVFRSVRSAVPGAVDRAPIASGASADAEHPGQGQRVYGDAG
jgi:hypothetical protein